MKRFGQSLAAVIIVIATWLVATSGSLVHAQSGSSGAVQFHLVATNSTNCKIVSPGPHSVFGVQLSGIATSPGYLKFFDKITAPIAGTDTPTKVLMIPAASTSFNGAGSNVSIPFGGQFAVGLGICVTAGIADNDATAVPASVFIINFDWQ